MSEDKKITLKVVEILGTKEPPPESGKTWKITYFKGLDEENNHEYDKLGTFKKDVKEGDTLTGTIDCPDDPSLVATFKIDRPKGSFGGFRGESPETAHMKADVSARQTSVNAAATVVAAIIGMSAVSETGKLRFGDKEYKILDVLKTYRDENYKYIQEAFKHKDTKNEG